MSLFARIADLMTDSRSGWAAGIGAFLSPAIALVETYVFGDMATVWFLFLLVGIDTMLGFRLAYRKRQLSSLRFARVLDKLLVYLALLAAAYAVARMGGAGADSWMFLGLRWLVVSYIFVREFISIVEKAARLGVGLPTWITKPLQDYADSGNLQPNAKTPPDKKG